MDLAQAMVRAILDLLRVEMALVKTGIIMETLTHLVIPMVLTISSELL